MGPSSIQPASTRSFNPALISKHCRKRSVMVPICQIQSLTLGYRVPEIVTRGDSQMEASQIQHGEPRRLVMSAPTPLRQDFDAPQVRGLARKTKTGLRIAGF